MVFTKKKFHKSTTLIFNILVFKIAVEIVETLLFCWKLKKKFHKVHKFFLNFLLYLIRLNKHKVNTLHTNINTFCGTVDFWNHFLSIWRKKFVKFLILGGSGGNQIDRYGIWYCRS